MASKSVGEVAPVLEPPSVASVVEVAGTVEVDAIIVDVTDDDGATDEVTDRSTPPVEPAGSTSADSVPQATRDRTMRRPMGRITVDRSALAPSY
jgi:hypothetical protein